VWRGVENVGSAQDETSKLLKGLGGFELLVDAGVKTHQVIVHQLVRHPMSAFDFQKGEILLFVKRELVSEECVAWVAESSGNYRQGSLEVSVEPCSELMVWDLAE